MRHPTVVLADDHVPMRSLIRTVLEDEGFTVVGEAANGPAAVELALELHPDLCLLDLQMPGGGGLAAVMALRGELPDTLCVVLTATVDAEAETSAQLAGAAGVVEKSGGLEGLPGALRHVLDLQAAAGGSSASTG